MNANRSKRYTDAERKEILDFIESRGRGGQTAAVKKYGVTPATIAAWKRKAGVSAMSTAASGGVSKQLKALKEMMKILTDIEVLEVKLSKLNQAYTKTKGTL